MVVPARLAGLLIIKLCIIQITCLTDVKQARVDAVYITLNKRQSGCWTRASCVEACRVGVVVAINAIAWVFLSLSCMWGMQVENSTICTTCNCVTSDDCASDCQCRVLKSICSLAPLSLCLSVCLSNCVSSLISTRVAISHTLYSMKWHSSLYIYTLLNRPTEYSYFAYNQFPRLDLKLT